MHQEVIMAGTGGQGIMIMGQLLAHAAVVEDKNVVWFPSYGPESRGGTADCTVIVSDSEIGSPVTASPDALIAMSQPMLDKFVASVKDDGVIFVNSSLAASPDRNHCTIVPIAASEEADKLGDLRTANMVLFGAFIEATKPVAMESVLQALTIVLPARRHDMIPINEKALRRGAELARTLR